MDSDGSVKWTAAAQRCAPEFLTYHAIEVKRHLQQHPDRDLWFDELHYVSLECRV
jgi:hypothetical protein